MLVWPRRPAGLAEVGGAGRLCGVDGPAAPALGRRVRSLGGGRGFGTLEPEELAPGLGRTGILLVGGAAPCWELGM